MKLISLIAFIILNSSCIAQNVINYKGENINALNENNEQTGTWKLYDDEKHLTIITEFKDGINVAPTEYYRDSNLIASYNNMEGIEIYKDNKTYKGQFFRKPDLSQTIIDKDGNELNAEILKHFYVSSTIMGFYYGGSTQLYDFIAKNINRTTIKNNKGKVKVKFVIDVIGNTSEIEITESSNTALNEEVKRIIGILPRWQPGHQAGAFVKCSFIIPVTIN